MTRELLQTKYSQKTSEVQIVYTMTNREHSSRLAWHAKVLGSIPMLQKKKKKCKYTMTKTY
jgi:hypothetical protein